MSNNFQEPFFEGDLFDDGTGFEDETPHWLIRGTEDNLVFSSTGVQEMSAYMRCAAGTDHSFRFIVEDDLGNLMDNESIEVWATLAIARGDPPVVVNGLGTGIIKVDPKQIEITFSQENTLPLRGLYFCEIQIRVGTLKKEYFVGYLEVSPSSAGDL